MKCAIFYESNDDLVISQILSGAMTGTCEPFVHHIGGLLSVPLALLYRVFPNVSWYGMFLLGSAAVSLAVILYCSCGVTLAGVDGPDFSATRTRVFPYGTILTVGLTGTILLSAIYLIARIQYTGIAALWAVSGYAVLIHSECKGDAGVSSASRRRSCLLFFCFELIAFSLRDKAMLLIQPLGMMALIGMMLKNTIPESVGNAPLGKGIAPLGNGNAPLGNGNDPMCVLSSFKTAAKRLSVPLIGLVLSLGIGCLGSLYLLADSGWKEYARFDAARVSLFDYSGCPDYSQVSDILTKYGISPAEYEAFCVYTMLDDNINADCLEELALETRRLAADAGSESNILSKWGAAFCGSLRIFISAKRWRIGWILLILWITAVVVILLSRDRRAVLPFLCLFAGRSLSWTYLLAAGRILDRVSMPLIFCEIVLLILLIPSVLQSIPGRPAIRSMMLFFVPVLLVFALFSGREQYRYARSVNAEQEIYIQGLRELCSYCDSSPKTVYLTDAQVLSYYCGSPFDSALLTQRNLLPTGCWFSNSPAMKDALSDVLNRYRNGSDICLITNAEPDPSFSRPLTYAEEFFSQKADRIQTLQLSHGGKCDIYRFSSTGP